MTTQSIRDQPNHILFICKANVWRSQLAEWLYRKLFWDHVLSIAGSEARKEKYHGKPLEALSAYLSERYALDISHQKISYIADFSHEQLMSIWEVCFLYDPRIEHICEDDCRLTGESPYEYFLSRAVPLHIFPVEDPFDTGIDSYDILYRNIENIILSLRDFRE